jgi:N-acetylglucosaminyldiphosphoundecaprenol N-acetyl-beta-D-mannosaminyltransferase
MSEYVTILNCRLLNIHKNELLDTFREGVLMPTNVDMIMKMQKDREFYECHCKADYSINDSQIIKIAAKLLGLSMLETISGSDFFPLFYHYHKNDEKVTIFLLGAAEGVAEKASRNINTLTKRKMIVGTYSPPFGFEKDEKECDKIVELITASKATVLAIGLGAPKQEKWISRYKNKLKNVKRILCIGATIDFEAGNIQRAPKFIRIIGFEWFYRLIKEPKRLWKRYLVDDLPFILLLIKQMLGRYSNPFKEITNDNPI